ncbi:flagellar biosynthesis protein FliR [Roseovarius atlanticus]|uniref:Flagellar biosynthesis protein FliR n=1 Tax=Roseovarius atlanticus TaxID=1641875 RepID=A0A0T5NQR4_9RHOB|nr:flagellar biosynthetic protein FliR [Roseovarius atlanticus]KRS11307.1 flagellar biosynthesis protein FliR [Roseovarius atlanticus]
MSPAAELLSLVEDALWVHFIVFLRTGPVMALFPGFGERTVPTRFKLVLAILFTIVIAPALASVLDPVVAAPPPLGWLILSETAVGLLIGIGLRMFLLALQTAGAIAAQSTSLSQILGDAGVTPLPAIGHLLVIGGLALAMILDLHVHVAEMMILTYSLFPVAQLPDPGAVSMWGIRQVSGAFALAFTLAAPFVIVSVLYNITLGVINRAMPQMMVVFVGAPVITGAGIALLFLLAPTMLTLWIEALQAFVVNPFGTR